MPAPTFWVSGIPSARWDGFTIPCICLTRCTIQILQLAVTPFLLTNAGANSGRTCGPPGPGQDSKQLWFAGTHCDVGGGLGPSNAGLSDITLRWMFDEATNAGLLPTRVPEGAGDPCSPIHPSLTL